MGNIDGYLAEDVYPSNFPREFSPAWIDAVLRRRGAAPPRPPRGPFSLLDLGCGDGEGLIVLAAAYPEGRFVGVDAMAAHVEHGQALAARLGLSNVSFQHALFADVEPEAGAYDYVTAQGVVAWVSAANRAHVYRIADAALRPDGVAVFGYNAMPGWREMLVFQHMVRVLAEAGTGPLEQRFDAAIERLRGLGGLGASGISDGLWTWFDGVRATLPRNYVAHEYLNTHWAPQWSDQVAGAMGAHGFVLAALANANRQREDFAFRAAQRQALAEIAEPSARELAADVLFDASFRIDVFARDTRAGAPQPRLDGWWAATVSATEAEYACDVPAGRLRFDNAAAHAILEGLQHGPQPLRSIHAAGGGGTEADVLNAADALFAGGRILPAEPPAAAPHAQDLNVAVAAALAPGGVRALAGRHGAFGIAAADISSAFAGDTAALSALARIGIDVRR